MRVLREPRPKSIAPLAVERPPGDIIKSKILHERAYIYVVIPNICLFDLPDANIGIVESSIRIQIEIRKRFLGFLLIGSVLVVLVTFLRRTDIINSIGYITAGKAVHMQRCNLRKNCSQQACKPDIIP